MVGFALTILSESGSDLGWVTGEADFSDGTTNLISRWIHEAGGAGDTFFGFKAPVGTSIATLRFSIKEAVCLKDCFNLCIC